MPVTSKLRYACGTQVWHNSRYKLQHYRKSSLPDYYKAENSSHSVTDDFFGDILFHLLKGITMQIM